MRITGRTTGYDLDPGSDTSKKSVKERNERKGIMENDLISRSALMEELNNFSMRITGSANAEAITIMEETKKSIAKMVDEQPTAYDVDKVAERLEGLAGCAESKAAEYDEKGNVGVMDMWDARAEAYRNSVKVVKSGGIE